VIKTLKKDYVIKNLNNFAIKNYKFNIFDLDIYLKEYIIILKQIIIYLFKNILLKNIGITLLLMLYTLITIILISIIKSILPKNIIYGKKIEEKNYLKNLEKKLSINNKFLNK